MKLSISNIGWISEHDVLIFELLRKTDFNGIEIAPTRIFPEHPYDKLETARQWAENLKKHEGFLVPSMQSIWYGRQEKIFGSAEERQALIEYTKKAIDFAEVIGCQNLVFGCPKNRNLPEGADAAVAVSFFREIGDYAVEHHTVIGMEANPPIYNTNFINSTSQALALIREVGSDGFKLNLDLGTMIYNKENVSILDGNAELINHVHISEPGLKIIEDRPIHAEISSFLKANNYQGYVSIEMGRQDDLNIIENTCKYVKEIFG